MSPVGSSHWLEKTHRLAVPLLFLTLLLYLALSATAAWAGTEEKVVPPATAEFRLIGWNDLGMHCMNERFENLCILPPFNTVHAQLLRTGSTPELMPLATSVEFSIEGNTYSAGKTNFWDWEQLLFGVNLAPDFGLTGITLSGEMERKGATFVAEGIPLTPFLDASPSVLSPYQIVLLIARDTSTGEEIARTRPVAPVSTEIDCGECHTDGFEGISTGDVETNILTLHDQENDTNLMGSRPVLCASCHGSNALGLAGDPELPNLSRAIHRKHAEEWGEDGKAANECYLCHPGQQTQCHRGVMFTRGVTCIDCHGDLFAVGASGRRPWIDLPRCGATNCHGAQFSEEPDKLYRNSIGHGGLVCTACHGSPHAIWPSSEASDNIQTIGLQGHAGTLDDCRVCHNRIPAGAGPHGILIVMPSPTPSSTPETTPTPSVTPSVTPTPTHRMDAIELIATLRTIHGALDPGAMLLDVARHWMQ
jgi:hypothetical protein